MAWEVQRTHKIVASLWSWLAVIKMVNSQSTADLTISKVYSTSYYGDTFNFTCMVNLEPAHKYVGVEFIMTQSFITGFYDYGNICYEDSSYSWENLDPPSCVTKLLDEGQRKVTISIQLQADMHDPRSYIDQVKYKCKLLYQSTETMKTESLPKPLPIQDIDTQNIDLVLSPKNFAYGSSVRATCTSTNPYATLSLRTVPQGTGSLENLSNRNTQISAEFTYVSPIESIECSDGGRKFEGKTYVRKSLSEAVTSLPSGTPTTIPPTSFSNRNKMVAIEVAPISRDANQSVIEYGKEAVFRCQVNLSSPLTERNQYYGMFLELRNEQGTVLEDGCVGTERPTTSNLFRGSLIGCPHYSHTKTSYFVSITFTVTAKFVGLNQYRCLLKERYFSYIYQDYFVQIRAESPRITILGIREPIISLAPTVIVGFTGESIDIHCSSSGGFPNGDVQLVIDSQRLTHRRNTQTNASKTLNATIVLSEMHNNKRLFCYNDKHANKGMSSSPIYAKYLRKTDLERRYTDISKSMILNCTKYVTSNTRLSYRWFGELVSTSQLDTPVVDILYSRSKINKVSEVRCQVSMVNDTLNDPLVIAFPLSFRETSSAVKYFSQPLFLLVITLVVLLTATIAGVLITRKGCKLKKEKRRRSVKPTKTHSTNHTSSRETSHTTPAELKKSPTMELRQLIVGKPSLPQEEVKADHRPRSSRGVISPQHSAKNSLHSKKMESKTSIKKSQSVSFDDTARKYRRRRKTKN